VQKFIDTDGTVI